MAHCSAPVRTCVGCRRRAVVTELLRVVAVDSDVGRIVVPDPGRRLPGRGASIHPDVACLTSAVRRRAFGRALREAGPLDDAPLWDHCRFDRGAVADEPDRRAQFRDHHTTKKK